jgi:hypothetical protein
LCYNSPNYSEILNEYRNGYYACAVADDFFIPPLQLPQRSDTIEDVCRPSEYFFRYVVVVVCVCFEYTFLCSLSCSWVRWWWSSWGDDQRTTQPNENMTLSKSMTTITSHAIPPLFADRLTSYHGLCSFAFFCSFRVSCCFNDTLVVKNDLHSTLCHWFGYLNNTHKRTLLLRILL